MTVSREHRPTWHAGHSSESQSEADEETDWAKARQLSRSLIQAHFSDRRPPAPEQVHDAALRGLEAPATELPHRAKIEASTGQDLSGVKAHVGGAGAEAANAMNADAYATGDHVVFAAPPDLRTAAHEAAHVLQQRGGTVQLSGGVGRAGDSYEQEADRVADAVVRGEAARIPGVAPRRVQPSSVAIQRQSRVTLIDASELPHQPPAGVNLPTLRDDQVSLNDNDARECVARPRSQVVDVPWFVDNGVEFVDPRGDPWTLSVDKLVFRRSDGRTFEVAWDQIQFQASARSSDYEKTNGVIYPLHADGSTRTFDEQNTPNIVKAARLVHEVIAELKAQRVEYAELTAIFAGAIAGLGGAAQLVHGWNMGQMTATSSGGGRGRGGRSRGVGPRTGSDSEGSTGKTSYGSKPGGRIPESEFILEKPIAPEVFQRTARFPGGQAEKARHFERLALEMQQRTGWNANRLGESSDGAIVYHGEAQAKVLVIDRSGRVFTGTFGRDVTLDVTPGDLKLKVDWKSDGLKQWQ